MALTIHASCAFLFCRPYTWILQRQCWWSAFSREPRELSNRLLCFPALALVSLESAERPNYFLCVHDDDTLSLKLWEANSAFHRRATFFHHQDLWIPGYSAFELYSKKGFFIILTDSSAKASKYDDSEEFKHLSSFSVEGMCPEMSIY